MPLIDPATELSIDRLLALRETLVEDLKGGPEMLVDAPGASESVKARGQSARQLVNDTLAWAKASPPPDDRRRLAAEINLLYDVTIVAAEYYKLFVRGKNPGRI